MQAASNGQQKEFSRIGLFDSGVGGLSVLRELTKLPAVNNRKYFYVGDTARCPYGNREASEISRYVEEIIDFLVGQHHVDAIVMACNTSAACAVDTAKRKSPVPVYDLISPTAKHVGTLNRKVGVLATASTVRSQVFTRLIKAAQPDVDVFELACPEFVPIIESGRIDSASTLGVVERYAEKLLEQKVEVLILGCTHFPFLSRQLEQCLKGRVQLINPAAVLRDHLSGQMNLNGACRGRSKDAPLTAMPHDEFNFFVTGSADTFVSAAGRLVGALPGPVHSVSVEQIAEQTFIEKITDVVKAAAESMTSPVVPTSVAQ